MAQSILEMSCVSLAGKAVVFGKLLAASDSLCRDSVGWSCGLGRVFLLARSGLFFAGFSRSGHHLFAEAAVWSKDAVKADQWMPRWWNECGESRHELHRGHHPDLVSVLDLIGDGVVVWCREAL